MYQEAKKKSTNVEQGFNRFSKKMKVIVFICLAIMLASCLVSVIISIVSPGSRWIFVGLLICITSLSILILWDYKDEKKHLGKYADSYDIKLDILDKLLVEKYNIVSVEKLEQLIQKYQKYIDKKRDEEKKRNKFIVSLYSAFAGVLSISLSNMDVIGIEFGSWLYITTFLLVLIGGASISIYSLSYVDSIKKKYEIMIKDLEDLKFKKY